MEASNSAIFRSLFRNQRSIFVMSWISSTVTPDLSASNTVKIRWSSTRSSRSRMGASSPWSGFRFRESWPISAPRTAFISAISKLGAMAMTSPVAFIWVPRRRLASANLSKGHLGIFTTM